MGKRSRGLTSLWLVVGVATVLVGVGVGAEKLLRLSGEGVVGVVERVEEATE